MNLYDIDKAILSCVDMETGRSSTQKSLTN